MSRFFRICCRFGLFVGEESVKKWTEEGSLLAIWRWLVAAMMCMRIESN